MKKENFPNDAISQSMGGDDQTDLQILLGLMDELHQHRQAKLSGETFIDAVHDLLGQHMYIDNLTGYKYDAVLLLGVLANSDVRKAIDESCRVNVDGIIETIRSLWSFMQRIDTELYKIQLLRYDIESFPDKYTDRMPELINEFAERLRIEKTGKLKSYELL